MLRASLAALSIALLIVWLVGLTDHSTIWLTWIDGVLAILSMWLLPVTREDRSAIGVSIGPALLGLALVAMFIIGISTGATPWLIWFTLAFGCGYLLFAGFAFMVRAFHPRMESWRPMSSM